MQHHHQILRRSLLALAFACTSPALQAGDDCDAPVSRWQSREAVRQMAAQRGWEIQRFKIDDGCYEIRGIDAGGREFKAKLDPQTLDVIKLKQRDAGRMRELVSQGALIRVCGSRSMARGVVDALDQILATLQLNVAQLKARGNYAEDVF